MRSLRREDWEAATLTVIAEGGLGAVHIDEIAQRLSVTKGSFYWHFDNRDALIAAALASWRDDCLARLADIEALPRDARLAAVAKSSLGEPEAGRVEIALTGVVDDERVTPYVEVVVERRLALLESAFASLDAGAARHKALLAHALYLGYLHTVRVDPTRRAESILSTWLRLFK